MITKRLPIGICEQCGEPFPSDVSPYTRRGPRLYCSRECRNTANSRNGNPVRTAKLRQAVAEGRWQNPHHLHPPTGEEQSARSRKGRLREVAEGRWRNPALDPAARAKLSRPRKHADDPVLHRAVERLGQGAKMADLTDEERTRYNVYRQELRRARAAEVRERQRACYHRMIARLDAAGRARLRARWRQANARKCEKGWRKSHAAAEPAPVQKG